LRCALTWGHVALYTIFFFTSPFHCTSSDPPGVLQWFGHIWEPSGRVLPCGVACFLSQWIRGGTFDICLLRCTIEKCNKSIANGMAPAWMTRALDHFGSRNRVQQRFEDCKTCPNHVEIPYYTMVSGGCLILGGRDY
jgi:hypothetical protein